MKKIISIRLQNHDKRTVKQISISDWISNIHKTGPALSIGEEEKRVIKGFIDLSGDSVSYIQKNIFEDTDHRSLLSTEFATLTKTDGTLRESVTGFQVIYRRSATSNKLYFNPSSNALGSATSFSDVKKMWKSVCDVIDFGDQPVTFYLKSKRIDPTLEANMKELNIGDVTSKKSFSAIQLRSDGELVIRRDSIESDEGSIRSVSSDNSLSSLSSLSVTSPAELFQAKLNRIPDGDLVKDPSLLLMMSRILNELTPHLEGQYPYALGNSMSWAVEVLGQKQDRPVGFVPFSGNCFKLEQNKQGGYDYVRTREISAERKTTYRNYLETIGFDPISIANGGKTLIEYTETGSGLYTFLKFMEEWADELGCKDKFLGHLKLIVFQGNVPEGKFPAIQNKAFDGYQLTFIEMQDKSTLQRFCDNEELRLIPSHKVYERDEWPVTNHTNALVLGKIDLLMTCICIDRLGQFSVTGYSNLQ